jgi:hypothetical protein
MNFINSTSVEQSNILIGLGIDVSTADLSWYKGLDGRYYNDNPETSDGFEDDDIPAWSLQGLFDLLPIIKVNGYQKYVPILRKTINGKYVCTYESSLGLQFIADKSIDAVFKMAQHLLQEKKM